MSDVGASLTRVVTALPLPPAGWARTTDVVVVGTGAAGLMTAVALADAGRAVTVVTKGALGDGSTAWAQGGLAAVLGPDDDADLHAIDTLVAGAGLCDEGAVRTLVEEAPAAVARLRELGALLDLDAAGRPALTREGGHSRDRIVHAGGDASGAEVTRTLSAALRARGITVLEQTVALDALRDVDGAIAGLRVARTEDGALVDAGDLLAPAVVLATGGYGQLYAASSNPAGATGDGLALALRAGAEVADVEMVQFHPTVLWSGPGAEGQQVLISEAVRGEGAVLVDDAGRRVMLGAHPLADLAPRDVVSATIAAHLRATGTDHVFLDASHLGAEFVSRRFPGISRACTAAGFDLGREPVPVAPAAHYSCGGVVADLDGRTSVPGLYAVGEVACTGVQGANRLASNSITEGLVAALRCAALLAAEPALGRAPATHPAATGAIDPAARAVMTAATTRHAGVVRDAEGLRRLAGTLTAVPRLAGDALLAEGALLDAAAVEATALHTVATLLTSAALDRTESRGCHRRLDFPETRPEWQVRLVHRLDGAGHVHTRTEAVRTLTATQVVA